MQVNSIQSSQNFGMALKITEAARPALEETSKDVLQKIQSIGKELATHKHVDVILGEGMEPAVKVKFANVYKGFFIADKPNDNVLSVVSKWLGPKKVESQIACYRLASKEAAEQAYEKINSAKTDIEKAAEFAKVIEENGIIKENERIIATAKHNEQKALIDDLFKEFGEKFSQ